jgi:hypothetical protein
MITPKPRLELYHSIFPVIFSLINILQFRIFLQVKETSTKIIR